MRRALHQHGEPMVQRELARALRCTPRHITALVDALQQRDLGAPHHSRH
jgi:DNA-binding MarR family transcriptional regulator